MIPALGGAAEHKVGDAAVPSLAWSADSRSLVISRSPAAEQPPGLSMLSIETGELTPAHITRRSTFRQTRGNGAERRRHSIQTVCGPHRFLESDAPFLTSFPAAGPGVGSNRHRQKVECDNFRLVCRRPGNHLLSGVWRVVSLADSRLRGLSARTAVVCRGRRPRSGHSPQRQSTGVLPFPCRDEHLVVGARRSGACERPGRPLPSFRRRWSGVRPSRRMDPESRSSRIVPAAARCGSAGATVRAVHR